MAKLSGSIDVPLPPDEAWKHASDLSRFKDWLTIHKVWRSKLPDVLEKGTVVESYVEVKGMPNRIKWTIVHYKPPEAMTLNGEGVGGVKVKLMAKVTPKDDGSAVSFNVHLGGPALFGPIGMIVAAALRSDIRESLDNFVRVFSGGAAGPAKAPDPGLNGDRGASR
jgi:carbon monoxide dehydrogenase subunit G